MSREHDVQIADRVEAALKENTIIGMNTLLCELSEDAELSQPFRFEQQMRLRHGVYQHGQEIGQRKKNEAERRRQQLIRGGIIV